MRDGVAPTTDGPRALRRWSLARRFWCDAHLPAGLIQTLQIGDVDSVLFESTPLQVKDRCVVGRFECESGPLLVKRHTWGGLSRTLRMAFRESAARSCARLGLYLQSHGIPTPQPRASVVFYVGPWSHRSYLLTDYVEGTPLYQYIRFGSQTADELRHLAGQVARIWQRLVELGASHNDFKPENFIVDGNLDVWLIDLEKVRLGGRPKRQRQRQIFDVNNFLHVRGWHHRAEARAIFAEAFLQTPFRDWFLSTGVERVAAGSALDERERDSDLSVIILCEDRVNIELARQAIDSVHDIADEILLVEPSDDDNFKLIKRIDICPSEPATANHHRTLTPAASRLPAARCPWVLALHQNECVTPFLAKELQQRIADSKAAPCFRIPRELQYFGRSLGQSSGEEYIRLFRQPSCTYEFHCGELKISTDSDQITALTGTILTKQCSTVAEFVDRLNDHSTAAAKRRFTTGQRPQMLRAAWRAATQFFLGYLQHGRFRGGWTGLQVAILASIFTWVEEAKLYQLAGEFRHGTSSDASSDGLPAGATDQHEASITTRSKAA